MRRSAAHVAPEVRLGHALRLRAYVRTGYILPTRTVIYQGTASPEVRVAAHGMDDAHIARRYEYE